MKFSVIKRKRNLLGAITNSQWAFFCIIFCFTISLFLNTPKELMHLLMILFFFGILGVGIYRFVDIQKLNADVVGTMVAERDYIQINDRKFEISQLKEIEFKIRHFYKEKQSMINGISPQYCIGKGNYYSFTTKDNSIINGEFLMMSAEDMQQLEKLYNKIRIKVKYDIDCY